MTTTITTMMMMMTSPLLNWSRINKLAASPPSLKQPLAQYMPCAYCGRRVEQHQWITTHNTDTNRQRLIHYYLGDNDACVYYTVCRPSCLLERLRHELQEMREQLDRLVRLADLIELEHALQREDAARGAPTPSGNPPPAEETRYDA